MWRCGNTTGHPAMRALIFTVGSAPNSRTEDPKYEADQRPESTWTEKSWTGRTVCLVLQCSRSARRDPTRTRSLTERFTQVINEGKLPQQKHSSKTRSDNELSPVALQLFHTGNSIAVATGAGPRSVGTND